jgi:multidrug efflux pump subunit AcrA (membrane-fusion protein)
MMMLAICQLDNMKEKKMKRSKLILILALGLFLIAGCDSLPEGFPGQAEPTPTVEVILEDFVPVVSATGKILPAEEAMLSMKTSGVVAAVLVSEDDVVAAGQVLVRLEGTENIEASIAAARFEVVTAQQSLDSLYDDPELALARALESIAQAQKDIDDAERRLRNYTHQAPQADIDQAYANMVLALDELEEAQEDYQKYGENKEVHKTETWATFFSAQAQAQKDYDSAVRHYNSLLAGGNDIDILVAEADLALAQAELIAAQRDVEILQDGPDPDDVEVAQARLENANAQLSAAEAALNDLELVAPFDGTIGNLDIHTGEWVSPGQPVILMADLSHLQVETTDLNEIDVAQIKIGDTAIVSFDALPDVVVNGTVTRIAPKDAEGSGVNYPVVIELDEVPEGIRWGMTAFVDIELE